VIVRAPLDRDRWHIPAEAMQAIDRKAAALLPGCCAFTAIIGGTLEVIIVLVVQARRPGNSRAVEYRTADYFRWDGQMRDDEICRAAASIRDRLARRLGQPSWLALPEGDAA